LTKSAAHEHVRNAGHERDEPVRQAVAHGLDVCRVARGLRGGGATVSRRYESGGE
jgi:hypothetical protein